jgi:mannan endo-1,4-beta-mannosidase
MTVVTLLGVLFAPVVGLALPASAATAGIAVRAGRLVGADGEDLVLRGINHGYTWHRERTDAFAGIRATGANAVRVVLADGQRWPANSAAEVAGVVAQCRQNRLICVLDVHDTVVIGKETPVSTLPRAVDYWISIRSALAGQEEYVILNIGDEPYGNNDFGAWASDASTAIRRLRAAGFAHTLLVDAPDWGQDASFVMRDNARSVLAADPTGNTAFSIHMYGAFATAAKVQAYMSSFVQRGLPLVVGEFSMNHNYGNPDEDAIMSYAQAYRIGYLGWSWSGNDELPYLNMVDNFDASRRTRWGVRFITGANGLSTTSREATIYRGGGRTDGGALARRSVLGPGTTGAGREGAAGG